MNLMVVFSLCLFSTEATQWTDNSINTMSAAKDCLHKNYLILFDALFKTMPRHSKTKDHVEAQTLDQMGSLLRTGIPSGEQIQSELPISLPQNAAGYRVRVFYP